VVFVKDSQNSEFAIKCISKKDSKFLLKGIKLGIDEKFSHPNLLKYHKILDGKQKTTIVMDYYSNGSLEKWIKKQERTLEEKVISIHIYLF
jgi:serine/threonine protein kinase